MAAMTQVRNDTANYPAEYYAHRTIAVLSDGSVLVAIWSSSTQTWYVYHSPDRITFTQKFTVGGAMTSVFSMAVEDTGDHVQVVWNNTTAGQTLYWTRYTKSAGPTFTWIGTSEAVLAANVNFQLYSCDIDTLASASTCVVMFKLHCAAAGAGTGYWLENIVGRARGTSGWGATWLVMGYNSSSDYAHDPVTCSADPGGASGGTQRIFVAGVGNSSGQQGGTKLWGGTALINLTSGAMTSFAYGGSGYTGLSINSGGGSMARITSFRGPVAGTWYLVVASVGLGATCLVQPDYFWWTGSALSAASGVTTTITCDWLSWCRPGIDMCSVTGSTYKKLAVFTRRGAGGAYCAVYDYNTWAWSGSFVFTGSTPYCSLMFSGAQRDFTSSSIVDVMIIDLPNGDAYFDFNQAPVAPTIGLTPVNGGTTNTDIPQVGVTLPALQSSTFRRKARFQIASDAGFTTAVKTFDEADTDLDSLGAHVENVSVANQLTQGTRYIRAATVDPFGRVSAYMPANTFTVSHPPNAINLVPGSATGRDFAGTGITSVDWDFSDTSSVDFQTAYQVIVQRNDTGATIYDSTKITSAATLANVTIPAANKDMLLQWKVILWDRDNVQGPDSPFATFYVGDAPTVTVTAPAPAGTANNPSPTITWTFTAGAGRTQTSYRVLIKQDFAPFTTVHDSGVISGAALTYTPPVPVLQNTTNYTVQVIVTDSFGLSGSGTNHFGTAWSAPADPIYTVDGSVFNDLGYVSVQWTNALKDASFIAWRVYRRDSPSGAWALLYETQTDMASYNYHDWTPKSGYTYDYVVTQVAVRFGSNVEGIYLPVTTVTAVGTDYWLIHPSDETYNCRLSQVTQDSFTDEYEEAELAIIGRGRKKDYGTHWGYKGSLSCEVWDRTDKTARDQRLALETLKAQKRDVYLRNPFGDMWLVTMGTASIDRVAGVGQREFFNLSLPYSQVA